MTLLNWLGVGKRLNIHQLLSSLIDEAALFGLPISDIANAKEMLEHVEYGCAFDVLVTQLYEYSIPITERYYRQLELVAEAMSIPVAEYGFAKELIK